MEFILTGDSATGAEFERLGVVTRSFPKEQVLDKALALAAKIASLSGPVIKAGKQAVLTGKSTKGPASSSWKEKSIADKGTPNPRSRLDQPRNGHDTRKGVVLFHI